MKRTIEVVVSIIIFMFIVFYWPTLKSKKLCSRFPSLYKIVRVLDGSRVASGDLEEVAFFDFNPLEDLTMFNGAWSR